jgi:hypothetical protein
MSTSLSATMRHQNKCHLSQTHNELIIKKKKSPVVRTA